MMSAAARKALPGLGTEFVTPELLSRIKQKQIRAGPGAPIVSYRKHGVICNNVISRKLLTFDTTAAGEPHWTPLQAYMIQHRNARELDGVPRRKQHAMLRRWYADVPTTERQRLAERANARQSELLQELREEETLKRAHRVHFTFIGSGRAFWACPSNFCRFFELTDGAGQPLAAPRSRRFVSNGERTARRKQRAAAPAPTQRATSKKKRRVSPVILDKTTLDLFDRGGDFTRPMGEDDVRHWWHRGLLHFQALDPELQVLFSVKPGERLTWLEPNSNYALWLRWFRKARALPEYAILRKQDPQALTKLLAQRYHRAPVVEIMEILDTSHTVKFPLQEAAAVW